MLVCSDSGAPGGVHPIAIRARAGGTWGCAGVAGGAGEKGG